MTTTVKPLYSTVFYLTLACASVLSAADSKHRPIVLNETQPLRFNTVIREKREIRVENGRSKQVNAKETAEVTTRYVQRLNLLRRAAGSGAEEVRVSEFMGELSHFRARPGQNPPPNEQPSTLMGRTLRVRKNNAGWVYEIVEGKPLPEERQTLDHLAFTAGLLELLSVCIGNEPRKVGDSWETKVPTPRGKAAGQAVLKDVSCDFVSLEDKADGPLATITITGVLSLERPMGYNSHVDITFEATLLRRLTDMLDLETKIKGGYLLKGEANIAGVGKTQLDFDYPFTLVRTLKIEGP